MEIERSDSAKVMALKAVRRAREIVEKNEFTSMELTKNYFTPAEKERLEKLLKERENVFDFETQFSMRANHIKKPQGIFEGLRDFFKS